MRHAIKEIYALGQWFEGYYISLKNHKVYSEKNGTLTEVKPRKNHGEIEFRLYSKGERFDIKLTEIITGLSDMGLV